jgi:hypothetical protein
MPLFSYFDPKQGCLYLNSFSVSYVPFAAPHDAVFSVSYGEIGRSDSVDQGRAQSRPRDPKMRGDHRPGADPPNILYSRVITVCSSKHIQMLL